MTRDKEPCAKLISKELRKNTGKYRPEEHEQDLCELTTHKATFRLARGFSLWKESER